MLSISKKVNLLDNGFLSFIPLCSLSALHTTANHTITLSECGKDTVASWLTWGGSVSELRTLVLSPVSWLSSFVSHLIASLRCAKKSLQPTSLRLQHVETGAVCQRRREKCISLDSGLHQKSMSNQPQGKKLVRSVLTLLAVNRMWR